MVMPSMTKRKLLNRVATRDLPLFMIGASYGEHLGQKTRVGLGFPLSKNYVLLDKGTAFIHRDNKEWYEELPLRLETSLKKHDTNTYIKETINKTAESIRFLQAYLQNPPEPSIEVLKKLHQIISEGVPGMIFAHWLPIFNEEGLATYGFEESLYFKESRKHIEKFFSLAADAAYLFLNSLGEQRAVDAHILKYATYTELCNFLELGTMDFRVIERRKKDKLLFVEGLLMVGNEAINTYLAKDGYAFEQPVKTAIKVMYGTAACLGKIRAPVQIIMSRGDFSLFKEGNILVAPMTSPEYTPLIHKASGIITNEGGLLSHAAIISRELKKPCLIGTKFGTDNLKNFQMVELNADEGFVTLL